MDLDPLQRLLAESDIRNLIAHLAQLADDGDIDEYLTLYAEDGSWEVTGDPPWQGIEGLRSGVEQRRRDHVQGPGTATRHLNTTLRVTVDGPDDATAESYFLYLTTKPRPEVALTGRYYDRFRRTADGWKMVSRRVVTEVN